MRRALELRDSKLVLERRRNVRCGSTLLDALREEAERRAAVLSVRGVRGAVERGVTVDGRGARRVIEVDRLTVLGAEAVSRERAMHVGLEHRSEEEQRDQRSDRALKAAHAITTLEVVPHLSSPLAAEVRLLYNDVMMTPHELVVVGAGVAGLSLARALARRGASVRVLERSRGLGGRCATRRVEGQPVDHGTPMLHGRAKPFVEELLSFSTAAGVTPLFDWPHHVRGAGTPCQPQASRGDGVRLAVREGVSAFAKHLARQDGVELELETRVERIAVAAGGFRLETSRGERRAETLILTPPGDQTLELLRPLVAEGGEELGALVETLRTVYLLPCLTLIAGYRDAPTLDVHLRLPGPPSPIHSLVHDSSKRAAGATTTLVLQAQPLFSRAHLEEPEARWAPELLAAGAELLGEWAARPAWQQAHRWRHARVARGSELSHASLLRFPGGARLGLCGDAFHPAGGVEGAYLSGLELATRLDAGAATSVRQDPGAATLSSVRGQPCR